MDVTFSNGSQRQRQWFTDAMAKATYDWSLCPTAVTVQWVADPPCSGHSDFACTQSMPGTATISIRDTLDSLNRMDAPVREFYQETCLHELGHVVMFALVSDPSAQCPWFFRGDSSSGKTYGTTDDLDPLDSAWEDRIQEAQAETFKDAFLPAIYRAYDNRTNWQLDQAHYDDFISAVAPSGFTYTPWSEPDGWSARVTASDFAAAVTTATTTGGHVYNVDAYWFKTYALLTDTPPDEWGVRSLAALQHFTLQNGESLDPDGFPWSNDYAGGGALAVAPFEVRLLFLSGGGAATPDLSAYSHTTAEASPYVWDTAAYAAVKTSLEAQGFTISGEMDNFSGLLLSETGISGSDDLFQTKTNPTVNPPNGPDPVYAVWLTKWAVPSAVTVEATDTVHGILNGITRVASDPIVPPWPYTDPLLDAGEGEWGVVRFRTLQQSARLRRA